LELQAFLDGLPRADTEVREARMKWKLVIDQLQLIVYALLCAAALVARVGGLVLSTFALGTLEATAFPGWMSG
jgi:hypothetical protein